MSNPKKGKISKPKSVDELEEEIKKLSASLVAHKNELLTLNNDVLDLQNEKATLEISEKKLKKQLEDASSKFSRYNILRIEMWTNAFMRLAVVATFAIVGPILLAIYLLDIAVDSILLDIFKVWLGAAIGISTNLLQKNEKDLG